LDWGDGRGSWRIHQRDPQVRLRPNANSDTRVPRRYSDHPHATARRRPATLGGLFAATAKVHGWTFVTRTVRNLVGVEIKLLNAFDARVV
jgi:hypothetical protein